MGGMDAGAVRSLCLGFAGAVEERPFWPEASVFKVGGKIFAIAALAAEPPRGSASSASRSSRSRCARPSGDQPGYHLNKRHWNTVALDGCLPEQLLRDIVEDSYDLVVSALPKRMRDDLGWP